MRMLRELWRASFGVVAVVMLLGLFVGCARSPKIRPLPADAVIVAFGDSLTAGYGAEAGQDYPSVLARLSGWRVINAGVPGELSATGLARLPGVLEEHRPALVLLCHGGNDILTGNSAETIMANLDTMIRLCREAGADVVLLAVPQKGLRLKPAPFYAEVAERNGARLAEDVIVHVLGKNALKSDYVHPNAEGYAQIAAAVLADLRRAQRKRVSVVPAQSSGLRDAEFSGT
jgi:lysophospholipase L1-like esterase